MPRLYVQRYSVPEGYYHVFNRSVKRRKIFRKPKDYAVFIRILKKLIGYIEPGSVEEETIVSVQKPIDVYVAALLPKHFHLIAVENKPHALTRLMTSLQIRYWYHLRRKYGWKGSVCQRPFRAKPLINRKQFREAYDYVRWNCIDAGEGLIWENTASPLPFGLKRISATHFKYLSRIKTLRKHNSKKNKLMQ